MAWSHGNTRMVHFDEDAGGHRHRPRGGGRLPPAHDQRRRRGADRLLLPADIPPSRNPADGRSPRPRGGPRNRLRRRHHPGHGGGVRPPAHRLRRSRARGRGCRDSLRRPQQRGLRAFRAGGSRADSRGRPQPRAAQRAHLRPGHRRRHPSQERRTAGFFTRRSSTGCAGSGSTPGGSSPSGCPCTASRWRISR